MKIFSVLRNILKSLKACFTVSTLHCQYYKLHLLGRSYKYQVNTHYNLFLHTRLNISSLYVTSTVQSSGRQLLDKVQNIKAIYL